MVDRDAPFFIAGCARSGTTLLRQVLVRHPRLECPEETHFFRWPDPLGSPRFLRALDTRLLRRHRELDGISESEFREVLAAAANRRELAEGYARLYLRKRGNPEGRWFDKTPQHVYGLLLLRAAFPGSPIVHLHRHPLNVVASLLEGRVMPPQPFVSAVNYWVESMQILARFREAWPTRLIELSYEALTGRPRETVAALLSRLGEDPGLLKIPARLVRPERNRYAAVLSPAQVEQVLEASAPWRERFGYDRPAGVTGVPGHA